MLDASVLRAEIVADAASIGYKNQDGTWKDDATIAGLLNAPHAVQTGTQALTPPVILECLAPTSVAAIEDAADSPSSTPVPSTMGRALAKEALLYIQTGQSLDVSSAAGQQFIGALQSAGLLTSQDVANLQTAAIVTEQRTRAQTVWGMACVIDASDVARARNA